MGFCPTHRAGSALTASGGGTASPTGGWAARTPRPCLPHPSHVLPARLQGDLGLGRSSKGHRLLVLMNLNLEGPGSTSPGPPEPGTGGGGTGQLPCSGARRTTCENANVLASVEPVWCPPVGLSRCRQLQGQPWQAPCRLPGGVGAWAALPAPLSCPAARGPHGRCLEGAASAPYLLYRCSHTFCGRITTRSSM